VGRLQECVVGAIEQSGLLGERLVVAVSGGPDSLALLHSLKPLQEPMNLQLHVAHVDHGLRPNSHDDAEFVRRSAESLGLECTVVVVEVGKGSPEEAARDARYGALAKVAADQHADAIAVGHTLDDQAETVLLHLARGSGLTGLRAMSVLGELPINDGLPVKVFRPLLGVRRYETAAFCRELGLTPILDQTNLDTTIPRNLIRLEAIPLLETLNPRLVEGLGRLTEAVSIDLDYVEARLDVVWPDLAEELIGIVSLNRDLFQALHLSLQRHALRRAYAVVLGSMAGLEHVHLESMLDLAEGPAGKELPLPGGGRMEARHNTVALFAPGVDDCVLPLLAGPQQMTVPGETILGGWRVCAEVMPMPEDMDAGVYTAYFDADALGGTLSVRGWSPGDRFQPLGVEKGTKKLQDFYVDAYVPQPWRERVPLVVAVGGIAWVVGHRIAHWTRVTPETQTVMKLEFKPIEG
jgi:tRNA(Ile)-lysidine synthase